MAKLSDLVSKYKGDFISIARLSAGNLATRVSSKTPKDHGDAQSSWTPSINVLKTENVYPSKGEAPRHFPQQVADKLEAGDTFYYANGIPYIQALEDGHSFRQAPQGMMKLGVASWDDIVDDAIREVKNGS